MGNTSKRSRCKYCSIPVTNRKRHLSWCKKTPTGISRGNNTTPSLAFANNPPSNIQFQIQVPTNICPVAFTNTPPNFPQRMTRSFATYPKIHQSILEKETSQIPFPHDLASRLTIDSTIAHRDPAANDSEFYQVAANIGNKVLYSSSIQDANRSYNNDNDDSLSSELEIINQSYSNHQINNETPSISTSIIDPLAHDDTVLSDSPINNSVPYGETLLIPPNSNFYQREILPEFSSVFRCYQILHKARVPFYVHDEIISRIGYEIVANGFNPFDCTLKRKAFINELSSKFKTTPPTFIPVHLESHLNDDEHSQQRLLRDEVEVVCFDFLGQIKDLLSDSSLFGDLDNLVVNKGVNADRWLPYDNPNTNSIYEVLDGRWYKETVSKSITDSNKQFLIPIGLYIDESQTVTYQRYSFQPLIMFPLILNLKSRNKATSSRVLALIPDLESKSSAMKDTSKGTQAKKGMAIRNFHKCMDVALDSFKKCQKAGGADCFLRLGDEIQLRQCIFPLAFVLGDAKSQDTISGRYGGHNCPRMCRSCNVSMQESDNPYFLCQKILVNQFSNDTMTYLSKSSSQQQRRVAYNVLHSNSQHAVINAFWDMDLGANPYGIYGATPHDLMHLFLEGILKYSTKLFVNLYKPKEKAEIDLFVDKIFGLHRSSEKKNMLRTNFSKGITNLTMLTADEQAGIALTILIVAQMDVGRDLLEKQLLISDNTNTLEDNIDVDDEFILSRKCNHVEFVQLMEVFLSFHAWYKSTVPLHWNNSSKEKLHASIVEMLVMIRRYLPRTDGQGWKIQKFHEHLHIANDVDMFGSPKHFDTGVMENRLIYVGKQHAPSIQKRGTKVFTRQLGQRIHLQQCTEKCKNYLSLFCTDNYNTTDNNSDNDSEASKDSDISDVSEIAFNKVITIKNLPDYSISINNGIINCRWNTRVKQIVPPLILTYLANKYVKGTDKYSLDVFTEVTYKGIRYRAHPNYRGGGAWYDWCIVEFEPSVIDTNRFKRDKEMNALPAYPPGCYPAKILAVFYLDTIPHCLIHTCESKIDSKEDSCLTERWYLEYTKVNTKQYPVLRVVRLTTIRDRVYVVQQDPVLYENISEISPKLVVLVKKRSLWPKYFTYL